MSEKLKIEPKFKNLIRPLSTHEYQQLEFNIKREGCREPIIAWRDTIIDGHNRYEICTRLGIPFQVKDIQFDSDEDAIAWICSNQLGRRNISEETRKYLIGKRYEAEKVIGYRRNASGWNQYTANDDTPSIDRYRPANMRERDVSPGRRTAERLGDEYHLSHSTVEKYGAFSKAVDAIAQKEPSLAPMILNGKYRISHDNLVVLSKQSSRELNRFIRRMEGEQPPTHFVPYSKTRSSMKKEDEPPFVAEVSSPSIKDMPEYDPDSDITGLTLTIPSWASSITRTKNKADLTVISDVARAKLENALCELQETINDMLDAIKED